MEQSAAAPPRQAAAAEAAAAKKKPTTLLDAYEVECIRRELQRLVLKHNQSAAGGDTGTAPGAHAHGHRHNNVGGHLHHHRVSSAKKATSANRVSPSPSPSPSLTPPPGPKKDRRHGVRLLGRHAVAICGGTVPLAAAAPVSGRGRRAMLICSGTTTAPVGCVAVGVDGRRRPRGGYREVEKV